MIGNFSVATKLTLGPEIVSHSHDMGIICLITVFYVCSIVGDQRQNNSQKNLNQTNSVILLCLDWPSQYLV